MILCEHYAVVCTTACMGLPWPSLFIPFLSQDLGHHLPQVCSPVRDSPDMALVAGLNNLILAVGSKVSQREANWSLPA